MEIAVDNGAINRGVVRGDPDPGSDVGDVGVGVPVGVGVGVGVGVEVELEVGAHESDREIGVSGVD